MKKEYYFLDLNLTNKKFVSWGVAQSATLTGDTSDPNVHRIFLTKGQYNKLVNKLAKQGL